MRLSLVFVFLMLWSGFSSASIFFQVTKRVGSFFSGTFYYDLLGWDVNDMTQNPCYQNSRCSIMITSSHNNATLTSEADGIWSANKYPWVLNSVTVGELGGNFKQYVGIPRSGKFDYFNAFGGSGCVGLFYNISGSWGVPNTFKRFPSSICAIPPEEQNACNIVMPQINLNHGILEEDSIDNNKVSSALAVTCTKMTNILLYINAGDGGVQLRSDGSLYSNLLLNEQPAKNGIALQAGPSGAVVQISSVLRKVGDVPPGPFQGSAVAILALP
ncbi:MAG: exotoxin [Serratia inhibens]|uniref:MrpH family fimbial adhesin n=1 Tax=Serratia inhibens TaxID=2338073 RepID=UPI003C79F106